MKLRPLSYASLSTAGFRFVATVFALITLVVCTNSQQSKTTATQPAEPLPADVNAKDSSGQTPLMLAAKRGDANRVRALIAAHASLDSHDNDGQTALFLAAGSNQTPEITSSGLKGCLDCLKQLIAAGADVNASDDNGTTPLMAAASGHLDSVEALIAAGADVNAKRGGSFTVQTALQFAERSPAIVAALQRAQQNPTKVAPQKARASKVGGRLLGIDVTNKTLRVIPWDETERRFKSDAIRVLPWTDATLLKHGSSSLTMGAFLGGTPINDEDMFGNATRQLRTAKDLEGLYDFYIDQSDDKFVVLKMDGVIAFAGMSFAGQVGGQ